MQQRHKDRKRYFNEQGITTQKYVIPYIEKVQPIRPDSRILEIGCGEGGNLSPFIELGCEVVGVDLSTRQIENAKAFISEKYDSPNIRLLNQNIYNLTSADIGSFDVIMMRDVIEHIPDQKKFLGHLKMFLKPGAVVFFGFPPWRMPFGGHQQICESRFLSKLPYFHLLPNFLYKAVLKLFGEKPNTIRSLIEIKSTGISIGKFEKIVAQNNYRFAQKTYYLINPNYEIKFGLTPRVQFGLLGTIPYFKDFFTTCMYCLIQIKE